MTTPANYRAIFERVASIRCNPENMQCFKSRYASHINSRRRLDSIITIGQLVKVLEKRDCINHNNIQILLEIAEACRQPILELSSNNTQAHHIQNYTPHEAEPSVLLPVSNDLKCKIYQAIASDIGQKWLYFARALGLRESHIDNLNNLSNTQDRVFEILRFHETTCDRRKWFSLLLHALNDARRNDLGRHVQNIYDTHPSTHVRHVN